MAVTIGKKIPRTDATAKVRGQATYVADLALEGSLESALLRSPHPFARIKAIDVSGAAKMPGAA